MNKQLEKFATQMDSALLANLRARAKIEGRQIQSLVEEAVSKLLDDRQGVSKRDRVMALHEESISKYEAVYKKLAE